MSRLTASSSAAMASRCAAAVRARSRSAPTSAVVSGERYIWLRPRVGLSVLRCVCGVRAGLPHCGILALGSYFMGPSPCPSHPPLLVVEQLLGAHHVGARQQQLRLQPPLLRVQRAVVKLQAVQHLLHLEGGLQGAQGVSG